MFPHRPSTFKCEHADCMDDLRERAALLLSKGVQRADLGIEFAESVASTSEVLVEGKNFYPRMLEDIGAAKSSIHVNQFGFRPGAIGETFAAALLAKAGEGVRVRLVVDRQGSDPERSSRRVLRAPGCRRDRSSRRPCSAAAHPAWPAGRTRSGAVEPRAARAHRPSQGGRGRRLRGLGRRRRDRGPLQRRSVPRPVSACHRAGRLAAAGRLRRDLRMAGRNRRPGRARRALPCPRGFDAAESRPSSCTTLPGATDRSPTR